MGSHRSWNALAWILNTADAGINRVSQRRLKHCDRKWSFKSFSVSSRRGRRADCSLRPVTDPEKMAGVKKLTGLIATRIDQLFPESHLEKTRLQEFSPNHRALESSMTHEERKSVMASAVSVAIAIAVVWTGSRGGLVAGGLPVFAVCGLLAFGLNWLVFVPAYLFQTERYFDLTGSLTYLSVMGVALWLAPERDPRAWLLGAMVVVWAVRLGSFLFARIRRDHTDRRFDALKPSAPRFFMTWTVQGLWVTLTASCALAAMTHVRPEPLGGVAAVGTLIWLICFSIEVVADRQKGRFRVDPKNRGHFIQSGLWAWSRHPNYFGEIMLWCGVAVVAFPALTDWQYVTLVSPVFVYMLLTCASGIPLLESRAHETWGDRAEYHAYVDRTPVLFPRPPRVG